MKKFIAIFIASLFCVSLCVSFIFLQAFHREAVSSKPDMNEWNLKNESFSIIPVIDDTVTFYIEDNQGKIVFSCNKEWRAWDFKSLCINNNNDIVVITGDMGEEKYCYNGKTWLNNTDNT